MQVATLQKKESAKSPELESSPHKDPRVDAQQEQTTEAGVPLFLQRFAVSSLSTPPPVQRRSEKKEEELIQTKPITPFVQREVLEEDEIEKNPVFPKLTVGAPNDKPEQEAAKTKLKKGFISGCSRRQYCQKEMAYLDRRSGSSSYLMRL